MVYDEEIANELANVFFEDTKGAEKIVPKVWNERSKYKQLLEKSARVLSTLLQTAV